jgi:hypothetical protein
MSETKKVIDPLDSILLDTVVAYLENPDILDLNCAVQLNGCCSEEKNNLKKACSGIKLLPNRNLGKAIGGDCSALPPQKCPGSDKTDENATCELKQCLSKEKKKYEAHLESKAAKLLANMWEKSRIYEISNSIGGDCIVNGGPGSCSKDFEQHTRILNIVEKDLSERYEDDKKKCTGCLSAKKEGKNCDGLEEGAKSQCLAATEKKDTLVSPSDVEGKIVVVNRVNGDYCSEGASVHSSCDKKLILGNQLNDYGELQNSLKFINMEKKNAMLKVIKMAKARMVSKPKSNSNPIVLTSNTLPLPLALLLFGLGSGSIMTRMRKK